MECRFCNGFKCDCQSRISKIGPGGRFCNRLIRNIAVSLIAEQIDLYLEYVDYDKISKMGIPLFIGNKVYNDTIFLVNENYMLTLMNRPNVNINADHDYFQTSEISNLIYNWFRRNVIKNKIMQSNPYNINYNNNNDCFIHVRLGDITNTEFNLGLKYYLKALSEVGNFDKLYIASDSPNHEIIQVILETYSGRSERVLLDEVETIQFGSTCSNVVLSHGSFSAVIGWLSFYSNVYYPAYEDKMWHGDMFSVNSDWHKITDYR